jgi:hypothetical protein
MEFLEYLDGVNRHNVLQSKDRIRRLRSRHVRLDGSLGGCEIDLLTISSFSIRAASERDSTACAGFVPALRVKPPSAATHC